MRRYVLAFGVAVAIALVLSATADEPIRMACEDHGRLCRWLGWCSCWEW